MQKVLVTGADGFIGSHLTEMLLERGYNVRALCYYNSFNNLGWLEGIINPRLEVVTGDIRDQYLCKQITVGMDIVFHLAALIAIPYSYLAPESYIDTNIKGTYNICIASKENNVGRVLITSTSEVYGTAKYIPIDENHPKQPQSPYSASKIGSDAIALSFYKAFDLPVVIVRPFNTYGPRQSARAIIPTIISQIASGMEEIRLGDLTPTRDLNYVNDTCRGFIELAKCDDAIGCEINVCCNNEISIKMIFDMIVNIMNSSARIMEDSGRIRPNKSEVFRLWGDNSLIKRLTGFESKYSLKKGLEETCQWFSDKKNLNKYKTKKYNV